MESKIRKLDYCIIGLQLDVKIKDSSIYPNI